MARDRTRSVHRIPALAICLPALGLPIVRISHRRGSLIPHFVKTRERKANKRKYKVHIHSVLMFLTILYLFYNISKM